MPFINVILRSDAKIRQLQLAAAFGTPRPPERSNEPLATASDEAREQWICRGMKTEEVELATQVKKMEPDRHAVKATGLADGSTISATKLISCGNKCRTPCRMRQLSRANKAAHQIRFPCSTLWQCQHRPQPNSRELQNLRPARHWNGARMRRSDFLSVFVCS